jgi:iron(III) transport system permease protein
LTVSASVVDGALGGGSAGDSTKTKVVRQARHLARTHLLWIPAVIILGFGVLYPLVGMEWQAFSHGAKAFQEAFAIPGIGSVLVTTFWLSLWSTTMAVVFGLLLAWCSIHLPARLQNIGALIPMFALIVPAVAAVSGWGFLLDPRVGYLNLILRKLPFFRNTISGPINVYSFGGIVFVSGLILTSFAYLFIYNGLRNIGAEYDEAAAASGASPLRIFFTITLPQIRPSIVYGAGITFILGLGQFTAPLLLGGPDHIDVISTKMFELLQSFPIPFGEAGALGVPLLGVGIIVVLGQRFLIGDTRKYATAGSKVQATVRSSRWWSIPILSLYGLLAVILPLLALIRVALSPYWAGTLSLSNMTLINFENVLTNNQHLQSAVTTSLIASAVTVLLVLPFGYLLTRLLLGRATLPRPISALIDFLVVLPYGTPAILVGFAMLYAYTRPPFVLYGTPAILIVAYCTIMVPYSVRLQTGTLISIGPEPWEASQASGASVMRTFFRVTVPLMRKGTATAAAIIFVLIFQEFSISVLVSSDTTQVVGSALYQQFNGSSYPDVAVLALLMVVITVVVVSLLLIVGGADALKRANRS